MSLHIIKCFFGMLIFMPSTLFALETPNIRPGLWEESAITEFPIGDFQPRGTVKRCYTEKNFIKDMINEPIENKDKNCTVTDYYHSDNQVTWKEKCRKEKVTADEKGQTEMLRGTEGLVELTYDETSFEITIKYDLNMGDPEAKPISIINRVKGKYIGLCP